MYFDGFVAKVGAGVYIISPVRDFKAMLYKLTFECTNNVVEYEALLLGLNSLKDMGAKRVQIMGDSELVINQVNDSYLTKHTRMRAYRNEVWDMFGNNFIEHKIRPCILMDLWLKLVLVHILSLLSGILRLCHIS